MSFLSTKVQRRHHHNKYPPYPTLTALQFTILLWAIHFCPLGKIYVFYVIILLQLFSPGSNFLTDTFLKESIHNCYVFSSGMERTIMNTTSVHSAALTNILLNYAKITLKIIMFTNNIAFIEHIFFSLYIFIIFYLFIS